MGKYKLVGILVGSAVSSYGAYEIYRQFGPAFTSTASYKDKSEAEAMEEDELNKDLLSNDEVRKDVVDSAVEEAQEPLKLEEKLESKQNSAPSVSEKPKEQPKLPINKIQSDYEWKSSVAIAKRRHLNPDGTIRIFPGSIGSSFRDYVITANQNDKVWEGKVSSWIGDLEYYKENKNNKSGLRNPIPVEFLLKRSEIADAEHLQRRCASSYRKKT